jgi:hypothetical protein
MFSLNRLLWAKWVSFEEAYTMTAEERKWWFEKMEEENGLKIESSYDDALSSMFKYLNELGIVDDTVKKIFRFAQAGRFHSLPGGGQREAEQLESGRRLVAWIDHPIEGYESIQYI